MLCVYLFKAIEQMVSGFLIHLQKWNSKYCPITHFSIYKRLTTEKEWTAGNDCQNHNAIELNVKFNINPHEENYFLF